MGIENRPTVGTWTLSQKELVQVTPDALVYINGDLSLPGCPKCNGRIDIQQFITEVSVEAGTDPGGASASFTLSLPVHHTDSFARDAQFILTPGLEVHVYMRGYFPVKGMYENLAEPILDTKLTSAAVQVEAEALFGGGGAGTTFSKDLDDIDFSSVPDELKEKWGPHSKIDEKMSGDEERQKLAIIAMGAAETIEKYWQSKYPDARVIVTSHHRPGAAKGNHGEGAAIDYKVVYDGGSKTVPMLQMWGGTQKLAAAGRLPEGGQGIYLNVGPDGIKGASVEQAGKGSHGHQPPGGSSHPHYDFRGTYGFKANKKKSTWVWLDTDSDGTDDFREKDKFKSLKWLKTNLPDVYRYFQKGEWANDSFTPEVTDAVPNLLQSLGQQPQVASGGGLTAGITDNSLAVNGEGESLLVKLGLGSSGLEDVINYPYYHVFHGVVVDVSHSWSAGVNTVSVQCKSMLHFWEYHKMSTNASAFGARPVNSKNRLSMVGHNFASMHPYQILYTLHHDMVGAAGGVGWALSQKTNQTAKADVTGESLFSLNVRYWQRRFQDRMSKLRMHGATGDLFTAAQTAYLGRSGASSIKSILRSRFKTPAGQRQGPDGLMESSTSNALFSRKQAEALLFTKRTRPGALNANGKPKANANDIKWELNIAEMQAFVSDLGQWGQINLFESSYQSKLDIAQSVCNITGFEFYQDVDGDFVFKPPMYNLDTSQSRVYRIEDIDIINISFQESEPQATYVTAKGSQFKNLAGTGMENEWGVKGQYIDHRLVAQFGWRPYDFETAYFNDPKSMFYAAINRLDILNAPAKKASLTIPVRAELRPGYPVYIASWDVFYYCNSFSHGFSVGGQCTTSLQLIGKRAKFFAPGDPNLRGIDAINLSDTTMPQRPLEALGPDGRPRLVGFPNVVMALDPSQINPLFFVVGLDIENISNPVVLRNLLKIGSELNILAERTIESKGGKSRVYIMQEQASSGAGEKNTRKEVMFYFQNDGIAEFNTEGKVKVGKGKAPQGAINLNKAAKLYLKKKKTTGKKVEGSIQDLVSLTTELAALRSTMVSYNSDVEGAKSTLTRSEDLSKENRKAAQGTIKEGSKEIGNIAKQIKSLESKISQKIASVDSTKLNTSFSGSEVKAGVDMLVQLINTIGKAYRVEHGIGTSDLNSTYRLLDMLSDKKAILSNGQQPGSYRYFSASHPDPKHQGQPLVKYSKSLEDGTSEVQLTLQAPLSERFQGTVVEGFLKAKTIPHAGAAIGEVQLGDITPINGVRILTSNKAAGAIGEIVPTSEIRELSFSVQEVDHVSRTTTAERSAAVFSVSGTGSITEKFMQPLLQVIIDDGNETVEFHYTDALNELRSWALLAVGHATIAWKQFRPEKETLPGLEIPTMPKTIPIGNTEMRTNEPINNFIFDWVDTTGITSTKSFGPGTENWSLKQVSENITRGLGRVFEKELHTAEETWVFDLVDSGLTQVETESVMSAYYRVLGAKFGWTVQNKGRQYQSLKSRHKSYIESPVFPVSDAQGYEVIGSYRYGRDVTIDPDGVFSALHAQDPFQLLDRETVESIVDAFAKGKPIVATVPVTEKPGDPTSKVKKDKAGNPVMTTVKLSGEGAKTFVESKVLGQLRRRLTDKQLLDLGLLRQRDGEPNMLELDLQNWISTGKEGVHKLPVANAAFSLAELNPVSGKKTCDCKAAEAGVLLEAFGNEDFLEYTKDGSLLGQTTGTDDRDDKLVQLLRNRAIQQSLDWRIVQDAYAGRTMTQNSPNLAGSFMDALSQFDSAVEGNAARQEAALAGFEQTASDIDAAIDDF